MPTDRRIDTKLAEAPDFARPILAKLRALIHAACPDATEDIKWGRPFFLLDGKPFAMMAAFKAHAIFGFWRMGRPEKETEGGGSYGKLTALDQLPGDAALLAEIKAAAETVRAERATPRPKAPPKAALEMPADLLAALETEPAAKAALEAFAPGHRREYLEWILSAKRAETRAARIAKAVEQLRDGRKLNWKYEKC